MTSAPPSGAASSINATAGGTACMMSACTDQARITGRQGDIGDRDIAS
jgi:hypothetical protein